ncbi:3-methyl-2-oxobutanoate hydroxymethyltransferase [Paenibacillus sp. FSL R5-0887]|jgi:3-methyl-2-oxobutanoate hydroxymethyltransferase|uniref:3-methyl-2-oxobutanoate hydroxymethyltransferase n=1 Tax=Paenibacillus odorifer TaxID=189426 RepID=A0A1R0XKY2_9BACL|nr:3-methyl-2-oxobutanoate hydroxymethyltransferase [Paenibacillus odorifer]AWV34755.1 3-methyl-2-oxobutanoate hydroxymethyltransferase [Paenibacillus odorifer]OMC73443.1 3-methyl-2-oxobutanoate hydroxymethyltransferase [Paenibacillus odorifer]OMC74427.1 3-methyl-2-oxobutanoate hydroxymethyltransferase [Paenibacillus odorifer]OMD35712.1 3-methyl-2-oxobutanoate hydroxymethyltransferase [Paenibacillus odorifer]OMD60136.1 3-methyl-2-oxobutanoate hydroxymethyltransferase [Paenibacillus odorifer]
MANKQALNIVKMKKMKAEGVPLSMLTAYDYPSAVLAEEAGIDLILVGDSLGNVVLGYDTTLPVTIEDMVYHTRSVTRGAQSTFIVADMPFMTYHGSVDETLRGVRRLMQEGRAHAVKMEGGLEICETVATVVAAGVPVLGHIGLTPQSVNMIGGYRIQGKDAKDAQRLMDEAKALEAAGAFAIVLELVTEEVAQAISEALSIPTIGIGAGRYCDGQVLVFHDLLRYASPYREKRFVKTYADVGNVIREGISQYVKEVKERSFPDESHVFNADETVLESLYGAARKEGK